MLQDIADATQQLIQQQLEHSQQLARLEDLISRLAPPPPPPPHDVFNTNLMAITLKKAWLMLFVALMLVLGTTGAEVDLGRKVGFGPTKNPVSGSPTDGNGDTEVDNHHSYRSTNRPETGD
ncbi:hypothetical protein R6Q57_016813 [Mikania cordata]